MKKIIISQEEKDRILESHNSYREDLMGHLFDKNLIKEQQSFTAPEANPQGYTEPSKVLKDAQTKCTQGSPLTKGTIIKVTGAGDAIKYKHEGDDPKVGASSGDTTYYFGNFTYQTVTPNNQIKTTGKWMCKALNVESGQCDAMKKEKQSQNFMTIEELNAAGGTSLANNPAMVEIITVCNEKLYRVNQKYRNQYQALTKDQKAYLDELYGIGGDNQPKIDPVTNAEVPSKWVLAKFANQKQINQIGFKEIVINPASNNPFDYPVTIYLKVEGEQKEAIRQDLQRMIAFVDKLSELDTAGVEPLIFMSNEVNRLRDDNPEQSVSHEEALRNAPKKDSDYFRIPKVLDK